MDRRSSSGTHFGSELIARVESSHGVRLDGGSTGGIVEAFGTDTSISLTVRAKNAGVLTLGNSSNGVEFAGSSVSLASTQVRVGSTDSSIVIGNSTTFFSGIEVVRIQFTPPVLAANAAEDVTAGSTNAAFTTSASFVFTPFSGIFSTQYTVGPVYCSTAGEIRIRFAEHSGSTIGTGESTQSANLLVFKHA